MLKIYEENTTTFLNNGIATLHPYKALVYKEDNGDYYIEIESPVEDYQYLQQGRIVRASTPWGWQGFRLQNPLRTARRVKVKGRHISFDSDKYAIKYASIDRKIASTALTTLNNACDAQTPFTFDGTDITSKHTYTCINKSFTEALSSVLEIWGGHLDRDNWNVALKATVGQDRGVVLAYGKNIKEIEADEDWSDVCTKILPIGNDGITLDETFLESTEKYNVPYTKIVEFKQDVDKLDGETDDEHLARLKADLKTQATTYLTEHHTPKVNYKVKAHLRDVTDVGDVIRVKHPKCNIELVTNVIKVVYDTIQNKYIEVEFGNYRRTLNDLISTVTQSAVEASKKETAVVKSDLSVYLQNATDKIYQLLKDSNIIYEGDKILAVDKLPKEEATNVMMISLGGIAFSNSGINGTFTSAWTLDGTLDMSAIHVINLTADMIDVTDLNAFNATIGGWNINDNALYSSYTKDGTEYNVYIKTPESTSAETGSYFIGVKNMSTSDYTFAVSPLGEIKTSGVVRSLSGFRCSSDFQGTNNFFVVDINADTKMTLVGDSLFQGTLSTSQIRSTGLVRTTTGFRCSSTFDGDSVFIVDVNGRQAEKYKMMVYGNASVVGRLATNDVQVRDSAGALVSVAKCLRDLGALG